MEDREGNGVGFEIEFGLTGRRRRPVFGEVRGKGNANRGNRWKPMPSPGETRRKGNVKRETKRNPMPLGLARSKKGSENGGNRLNPMPSPGLAKPNK